MFLPALATPDSVFFFRDISQNHHPYRELTQSIVQDGEAPLWNPLRGAGQPLLANPNALVLHPTTLLFLLMSTDTAMKLSVILQIFIASAGMWLLLRDIGTGRAAALAGASIFAFSGYMLSLGNLLNLLDSAAFMPWTVMLAGRGLTRTFRPWGSLAAASLAVQLLAGEPAILLCTIVAFVGLHWSYPRLRGQGMVNLARFAAVLGLSVALSMVGLLPALELFSLSERGAGFDPAEAMKWSQPPPALLETVFGGLFGDPTRMDPAHYWGGGVFDAGLPFILSTYVGPISLLLAAMGFWTSMRPRRALRPEAISLAALLSAGVVLALGRFLPVYPVLLALVPPLQSVRYPVKYMLLAVWALSILAARGADWIVDAGARDGAPGRRRALAIRLAAGGALAGLYVMAGALLRRGFGGEPASESGWPLLLATGGLLFVFVAGRPLAARRAGAALLLAVPVMDLGIHLQHINPVTSGSFYTRPPLLGRLLPETPSGRLWAMPRPPGFGFRRPVGAEGEDEPLVSGFLWDRMTLRNATYFEQRLRFAYDRGNERLDIMPGAAFGKLLYERAGEELRPEQTSRLLSLAGVERIISYGGLEAPGFREEARLEGRSSVPVVILRNARALPRAYFATRIEIRPDLVGALARMRDSSFDPARTVILEEGISPPGPFPDEAGIRPVEIAGETPTSVQLRVSSPTAGYLVLLDSYYPGWEAEIDGAPAGVVRANGMFRAVAVTSGTHRVEFRYRPSSVRNGLIVSLAGLLLAAMLAVPRGR